MVAWIWLGAAIASEVVATLELRELANGFRWVPAVAVVAGYVASFVFMIPALKTINVGVSYAIWSAVGTTAVVVLGLIFFNERINALGIGGIVLILGGVIMLTASGSTTHA